MLLTADLWLLPHVFCMNIKYTTFENMRSGKAKNSQLSSLWPLSSQVWDL